MKATVEQLAKLPLFVACQTEDLERLQPHTQLRPYQRKEMIVHEGNPLPAKLYILFSGVLQVQKNATTGKETILRSLRAGDIFAAPALFGDEHSPATIVAIEDCQVLTIPRAILLEAIQHPRIGNEITSSV